MSSTLKNIQLNEQIQNHTQSISRKIKQQNFIFLANAIYVNSNNRKCTLFLFPKKFYSYRYAFIKDLYAE